MMPFATIIAYYPVLNVVFAYLEPKSITAQRKVHCQFSADRVDQRLQEGSEKTDVWNLVLSAQGADNEALSLKEMHSNAELFMLAGSETTGKQTSPHY
jgi:cytochrome P450